MIYITKIEKFAMNFRYNECIKSTEWAFNQAYPNKDVSSQYVQLLKRKFQTTDLVKNMKRELNRPARNESIVCCRLGSCANGFHIVYREIFEASSISRFRVYKIKKKA